MLAKNLFKKCRIKINKVLPSVYYLAALFDQLDNDPRKIL